MVRKRKVELYDILSGRQPENGQQPEGTLYPSQSHSPFNDFARKRTGHEVVFSLNGAFVIFVAFLIITGTVYKLGYDKGTLEERNRFKVSGNIKPETGGQPLELSARVRIPDRDTIAIAPGKFTLKILSRKKSQESLRQLRKLRESLLSDPLIANSKLETIVFNGGGNKTYSLSIGVFDRADNQVLQMLRDYIRQTPPKSVGNSRLEVSVERIDDLGKPLL